MFPMKNIANINDFDDHYIYNDESYLIGITTLRTPTTLPVVLTYHQEDQHKKKVLEHFSQNNLCRGRLYYKNK